MGGGHAVERGGVVVGGYVVVGGGGEGENTEETPKIKEGDSVTRRRLANG